MVLEGCYRQGQRHRHGAKRMLSSINDNVIAMVLGGRYRHGRRRGHGGWRTSSTVAWGGHGGGGGGGRLTHGGGEDHYPEDVHAVAVPRPGAHQQVWGRGQVQGKVLDVGTVVVLDTVDEGPPRAGLW